MTQVQLPFQSRRAFFLATTAALASATSCSRDGVETEVRIRQAAKTFKMGERASAGNLTYNVLEATFFSQLGDIGKSRIPQKRFLVVRMSITNGGAKEVELPLFRIIDNSNIETPELSDADFLKGWFGLIRKIGPTQTEEGRILFDVAPKNYKLEVTDGGEVGKEQLAFIEIPIDFDTTEPVQAVPESSTKK